VAVYLSRVCADSPLLLRRCEPGEKGVVLSRYHELANTTGCGPAAPLPVCRRHSGKGAALRRCQAGSLSARSISSEIPCGHCAGREQRRDARGSVGPVDRGRVRPNIYGFEIETSEEKDDQLIGCSTPDLTPVFTSCCREIVPTLCAESSTSYYPGALHRTVIADLGVTTPKQIAKCLVHYGKHHPELQYRTFIVPQFRGRSGAASPCAV